MPDRQLLLHTTRFAVEQVEQRLADGSVRPRAIVRHPGAVVVLPLLDDGRICLIRSYRVSVQRTLLELPAGTLESGERPEDCAARELLEETGYRAKRLELLHTILPSPGILDERMFLFAATGLVSGDAAREPGEEIENLVVPWETALAMLDRREIDDAKTIATLLLYDRWRR